VAGLCPGPLGSYTQISYSRNGGPTSKGREGKYVVRVLLMERKGGKGGERERKGRRREFSPKVKVSRINIDWTGCGMREERGWACKL